MMSRNRRGVKDRRRAEHDDKVNLKAELEIRHLHAKLDLMMTHQWQRLPEIQQVQTDLLEELSDQRGEPRTSFLLLWTRRKARSSAGSPKLATSEPV